MSKPLFFSLGEPQPVQEERKFELPKKNCSSPNSVVSFQNGSSPLKHQGFFSVPSGDPQPSMPPKQEDSYKITFQNLDDNWPVLVGDKKGVGDKERVGQMTISVGFSPKHCGLPFKYTLKTAVKKFREVIIMLDDSVQWRTLEIYNPNFSEQELRELAIRNGDEWLAQHEQYINQYPNVTIVRWKNFEIEHPSRYHDAVAKMKALYEEDNYNDTGKPHPIKEAIDRTAQEFLRRQQKREDYGVISEYCTEEKILRLSRDYLIEECAIMAEFWPDLRAHYELYPGKRTEAMAVTHQYFIKDNHPDLLHHLLIRFNKKSRSDSMTNLSSSDNSSNNSPQPSCLLIT